MAEHFSFFDAVQLEDGTYEEEYEYDAQKFTNYFKTLVTTGVMKSAGKMLAVSTSGSNMVTKVNTGIAFIEGRYYENDGFKELTHDTETLGNSRIDRIVIRMDLSTEARYVKAFIKKGVPSTNPVAPTLTQTPNLYEISLAQVKIVGGQTFIATNAVTDERGIKVICPWAGSNILPNFDDNAMALHIEDNILHTRYAETTGTDELFNISIPGLDNFKTGDSFVMKAHISNKVFCKISVNGANPVYMVLPNGGLPDSGMIRKGGMYTLRFDGTYFCLQGTPLPPTQRTKILPYSGWQDVSTYAISYTKTDKTIRLMGEILKTSTSPFILASIPIELIPTVKKVPFLVMASVGGAYKTLTKSKLDSNLLQLDPTERSSIDNDTLVYFDFSYNIVQ